MDTQELAILERITNTLDRLDKEQGASRNYLGLPQQKAISGTPDAQLVFGAGGLFSNFGLDDTVISAHIAPKGIDSMLPVFGTNEMNPVYAYLTGFEGDGAAEPEGPCDDAPGGVWEVCHQVAQFGRVARSTKEMEVNLLNQILNRRQSTDIRLMGSVLGAGHQLMPQNMTDEQWIQSVVKSQLVTVGIEFQRWISQKLWTGNPANNTSGGYSEFPGLDMLIATGKVDAFTNVACPALDPDVKDFNYSPVDGTARNLITYMSYMLAYLTHIATRVGLDPVEWVIAMRPELFFEVTAMWPCMYLTDRCGTSSTDGSIAVINDATNVSMRDEMRNGMYLYINGIRVPVVMDDGINEQTPTDTANLQPGQYASDIYFLPLRAKGMPTLYWEHLDYTGAMADVGNINGYNPGNQFWPTDGGRFLWTSQAVNYCFKIQGKMEPRIILRTPHLCGRIQNIRYEPLQHLRSPFPDSPYFDKGGLEDYDTPQHYYNEWDDAQR